MLNANTSTASISVASVEASEDQQISDRQKANYDLEDFDEIVSEEDQNEQLLNSNSNSRNIATRVIKNIAQCETRPARRSLESLVSVSFNQYQFNAYLEDLSSPDLQHATSHSRDLYEDLFSLF